MKYIILICSILLTAYKIPNHNHNVKFQDHASNIDTSRYAIFRLEDEPTSFDTTYRPAKLSEQEMGIIENIIDKEIAKTNKEVKKYLRNNFNYVGNPKKYYKQIIAGINKKGEKEVWVNCFCSIYNDPNWKKRIVFVLDGGSCYFQLKINLSKKKAYDLTINSSG